MILPLPCYLAPEGVFTHMSHVYNMTYYMCIYTSRNQKRTPGKSSSKRSWDGLAATKKNCMLKEKSELPKAPLFISSLGASHLSIILSSPVWLFCCSQDYFGCPLWDAHSSKTTPFSGLSQGREIMLARSNAFIDSTSVQCWVLLFSNHGFKSKSPYKTTFSHDNMK